MKKIILPVLALHFALLPGAASAGPNPLSSAAQGIRAFCQSRPAWCGAVGVTLGVVALTNGNCMGIRQRARHQCESRRANWQAPGMTERLRNNPQLLQRLDADLREFGGHVSRIQEPMTTSQSEGTMEHLEDYVTGTAREGLRQGRYMVQETAGAGCHLYEDHIDRCVGELAEIRERAVPVTAGGGGGGQATPENRAPASQPAATPAPVANQ